jgi:hypothetical protein
MKEDLLLLERRLPVYNLCRNIHHLQDIVDSHIEGEVSHTEEWIDI